MKARSKWERIGRIGNDAGMMMLVDPCYVLHRDQPDFLASVWGEDWDALCKRLYDAGDNVCKILGGSTPNDGIAAIVSSGHGDGVYPVSVRRKANGDIAAVLIEFLRSDDEED